MSIINTIRGWFRSGTENVVSGSEAIVTEFQELTSTPEIDDVVEAQVKRVERISEDGVFHSYSIARIDFDLGQYGTYPVELALPRFPQEESELEEFMNRLGVSVERLPEIEQGNFTVPFVRVNGEWQIDWDNVKTYDEFGVVEE